MKNAPDREEVENFQREMNWNKVKQNAEAYWIKKTSTNKIQAWNGAQ
jgi:hypothetical protein